jgi:hypothetical protein
LGISKDTTYRLTDKEMPAHKVGKLLKFKIIEDDKRVMKGEASDDREE